MTIALAVLALSVLVTLVNGSRVPGQYLVVIAAVIALLSAGARPVVAVQLFVIAGLVDGALAWDLFRKPAPAAEPKPKSVS